MLSLKTTPLMIDKPPSLIRARNDDAGQAYHIYYHVFSRITAADLLVSYYHEIKIK